MKPRLYRDCLTILTFCENIRLPSIRQYTKIELHYRAIYLVTKRSEDGALHPQRYRNMSSIADPEILKDDNVSAPVSFIANAHN